MEYITSRNNELIKKVRKLLSDGAYRRQEKLFICDGYKLLKEALFWGDVRIIIRTEAAKIPDISPIKARDPRDFPDQARKIQDTRNIREIVIPEEIMKSVAPSKTPQGVLCVCAMRNDYFSAPEEDIKNKKRYLILDGVQDPGNVGTILRTADAFDTDGVFSLPGCADVYHPKTIRAAMGAVFKLKIWPCNIKELGGILKRQGIKLYGAAARENALDIRAADFADSENLAVAIGSEGQGLSDDVLKLCDEMISIPMKEGRESLNAATAAGIILWEAFRDA